MEVIPGNSCRRAGSKSGKGKPVITGNWGSVPLGKCVSQGQSEGRGECGWEISLWFLQEEMGKAG